MPQLQQVPEQDQPVGRIGVFDQPDRAKLTHEGGTLFSAEGAEPIVVMTAISIPIMPKRLPARLDSGLESPRSARMKSTPETR